MPPYAITTILTEARDGLRAELRAHPDWPLPVRRELVELCARMQLLSVQLNPLLDLDGPSNDIPEEVTP